MRPRREVMSESDASACAGARKEACKYGYEKNNISYDKQVGRFDACYPHVCDRAWFYDFGIYHFSGNRYFGWYFCMVDCMAFYAQ